MKWNEGGGWWECKAGGVSLVVCSANAGFSLLLTGGKAPTQNQTKNPIFKKDGIFLKTT